jgi:hypothetical protein
VSRVKAKYDICSRLSIRVEIAGEDQRVDNVLLDTGFAHSTFGLILPRNLLPDGAPRGSTEFTLADGSTVPADTVPSGLITRVDREWLGAGAIPVPVAFMDGPGPILGTRVMKRWVVEFDGPHSSVSIDVAP